MFRHLLASLAALLAATAFAGADVNQASRAELEAIRGVGPDLAGKILDARNKGPFKDWTDFVDRVKGVGGANAAKLSAAGLTVGGASFNAATSAPTK